MNKEENREQAAEAAAAEHDENNQEQTASEAEATPEAPAQEHAEFDNFRKRSHKEKADLIANAGAGVIKDLLPVVDDFDRAIAANADNQDIDAVKEGFVLIQQKMLNLLQQKGLTPMDSLGKPFDVDEHEALTQIPAPTEDQKGKVVDVIEKGYLLNDRILRYAKVVVGQ